LIDYFISLARAVSVIVFCHIAVAAQPSAKNILNGIVIAMPVSGLFGSTPRSVTIWTRGSGMRLTTNLVIQLCFFQRAIPLLFHYFIARVAQRVASHQVSVLIYSRLIVFKMVAAF
jgi:hypothetical protein